jgi:hypothetical protein
VRRRGACRGGARTSPAATTIGANTSSRRLAGSVAVLVHNCPAGGPYKWAPKNADKSVLGPGEAWEPGKGTAVIGRQADTEVLDGSGL